MAQAKRFVCDGCGRAVEAWSDGNPYFLDESGAKQYAYHPNHEGLAQCKENDTPYHCLGCGAEFNVDSSDPVAACPRCETGEVVDSYELDERRCPYCKAGKFAADPEFFCIS